MTTLANDLAQQNQTVQQGKISTEQLYEMLGQAVELHRTGQWREAESLYRSILQIDPKQPNANHNLGILALDADHINESLDYFKTALTNDPDEPQFWVSYVDALIRANLIELATSVLVDGLEHGLHGDEVNELVDRITKTKETLARISNESVSLPQVDQPNKKPAKNKKAESQSLMEVCSEFRSNHQVQQALDWMRLGKLKEAKGRLTKLVNHYPQDAFIKASLGVVYMQENDLLKAADMFVQSLDISPNQMTTICHLGKVYLQLNRYNEVLELMTKAIGQDGNNAEVYAIRASAFIEMDRHVAAMADLEHAKSLGSKNAIVYANLGLAQYKHKQYQSAAENLKKAIEMNPRDVMSLQVCATVFTELKQNEEAISYLKRAIKLVPNNAENYNILGVAYMNLGQYQKSTDYLLKAIRLNPKFAKPYCNLCLVYRKQNQYTKALQAINKAIELDATQPMYYLNLGMVLGDEQRFIEAESAYNQGLKLDSEYQDLYWNKALLYLLQGNFTDGWRLFEYRWQSSTKGAKRTFTKPIWLGEQTIQGKRLLVHAEQGLGDSLQFCRYLPILEAMGVHLIVEVPAALITVLKTLSPHITWATSGSPLPEFDYYCPMMSLPLACRTTLETIPAKVPYLFADADKVSTWQKNLGISHRPKIGLVWSGSVGHSNDHNRSLSLSMLAPILSVDAEFHVLQKEIRDKDIELLKQYPAIQTHCDELKDFSDTAALIQTMDWVISVDTSVAHLAGAMAKPCWVLLPYTPDYRWLLDREDSPWYPSIRLFRQQKERDWQPVIASVKTAIERELAK